MNDSCDGEPRVSAPEMPLSVRDRLSRVRIVLVQTSHPGNIGATARAMKAMGLSQLYLVSPNGFPSADATSRAAGADDLLARAIVCDSLVEATADCALVVGTSVRARHLGWPAISPRECAQLANTEPESRVALVFGRENSGLTNAELDHCTRLLTISTEPDFRSLNVASAVQLLCYEFRMAALASWDQNESGTARSGETATRASGQDMERLYAHLESTLVHVGYLDPDAPKLLMRRMRRFFARAGMLQSEMNIWRGVFAACDRLVPGKRTGVGV